MYKPFLSKFRQCELSFTIDKMCFELFPFARVLMNVLSSDKHKFHFRFLATIPDSTKLIIIKSDSNAERYTQQLRG